MKFYRILTLTFFAYTLISCGGAEERKSVYMEKAKASIEAGDLEKARIELKNVLQIDPKDGEAYHQIGSVYEQQKDYRKAYGNYLKAEELSPELLANHAKLGRFYLLLMNDKEKAQEKVDLILSKDPTNTDGLLLKAALLLRTDNQDKTLEVIELVGGIVAENPGHIEGSAFLATLHIKNKNNKEAINVLDAAIDKNKNNEKLTNLLAQILVADKKYERAEAIYKQFLEENPDGSVSYNRLAAFYARIKEDNKAEEILRLSIENAPSDESRILKLAKYLRVTKGEDIAIKELKSSISANNRLGKIRLALAELFLLKGEKEEATQIYNEIVTDFSEDGTGISARTALAAINISEKRYDEAISIADEALLVSPNDPKLNFLRAKLALRDKDYEKAIITLRIVTKETPDNIDAFILLANVYKKVGNAEQATVTLNNAYDASKANAEGLLKLSQYYVRSDIKKAEKIIDQHNKIKPSSYEGLSIKAAILNQNKQQPEAFQIAEKLMETYSNKENGYLQAIPYYGDKKDIASAVSVLEKGYINVKNNRKILTLLTTLQVKQKKIDVVKTRLNAEIESTPEDSQLLIMLAKVYLSNNELQPAEELLENFIKSKSGIEEPYLLLSSIYQSKKDLSATKSILAKGVLSNKSSLKIAMKLAGIYEREESYNKAINVYKEINSVNPDNLLIVNNLTALLSDYGNGKDDLALAKKLSVKLKEKNQPVFQDTLGWMHYKLGDAKEAIQYLSKATEKSPDINVFNYHLGMAYILSGDKVKSKIFLEKSLADKKSFKERAAAEKALKKL